MYQIGVSWIPEPQLQYQIDGSEYECIGNRNRVFAPSKVYHAAGEDKWITRGRVEDKGQRCRAPC
jgi:hypothetical protein